MENSLILYPNQWALNHRYIHWEENYLQLSYVITYIVGDSLFLIPAETIPNTTA